MELTELKCTNCAAPLEGARDAHGLLRCDYCGRSHHVDGSAETPAQPPAQTPAARAHQPGDPIAVRWGGGWWPATVVRRVDEDRWKIHYDGWSSSWDEVVGPQRIRDRSAANRAKGGGARVVSIAVLVLVLAVGGFVVAGVFGGDPSGVTGSAATEDTVFEVGQEVQIEWNGVWYDGTVLSVDDAGRPTVRYDGYGEAWDETVGYERLRVP